MHINPPQSLHMTTLTTIEVCQAPICQQKGSKTLLHRFHEEYATRFRDAYPELRIVAFDCNGECEQGPIVKINETLLLRHVEKEQVRGMLENPESMIGDVQHVLEKDRETFDRIVDGDLY